MEKALLTLVLGSFWQHWLYCSRIFPPYYLSHERHLAFVYIEHICIYSSVFWLNVLYSLMPIIMLLLFWIQNKI